MEPQQINPINPIESAPPAPSGASRFRPWLTTGIAIVVTALVVGGGVYWLMSKRLAAEHNTLNTKISELEGAREFQNKFDIFKIHPGDSIAEMTVVKVEPFNSDRLAGRLAGDNAIVQFSGQVNIAGRFYSYPTEPPGPGVGQICFKNLEEWSVVKVPLPYDMNTVNFCFSNDEEAVKYFGPYGTSGEAEIVIDDYTFISYPASLTNTAKLVRVISKDGVPLNDTSSSPDTAPVSTADWKTYKGEKYQFKYPVQWSIGKQGGTIQLNTTATAGVMNAYTERLTKNPQTELLDWLAVELGVKREQIHEALDMIAVSPRGGKGFRMRANSGYGSGYITYLTHNSESAAVYKIACTFRANEDICLGFSNSFEFTD